ncbi:MAG: nickel-dependent hydrogenase large subunit [bacterium]
MNLKEIIEKYEYTDINGISYIKTDDTLSFIKKASEANARLSLMFGEIDDDMNVIKYVFDQENTICEVRQNVINNEYDSIYNIFFNAVFFEKEIHDMFGWVAIGNDRLTPLVHHENFPKNTHPLQKEFKWNSQLEWENNERKFLEVEGKGVFEIPVGPVHAGVIEPGHFRFSLAGERILNIEPMLWFQHKGTEKLFENIDPSKYIYLSERISGDTSVSHALAYVQAVEKILNIEVPKRAQAIRVILSELERIYNHVNDIGFIGQDTGFGVAGAQGMRLKELVLIQCEKFTGSRVMRNVLSYGGITFNPDNEKLNSLNKFITEFSKDYKEVIDMTEEIHTMVSRMEKCGIMKKSVAIAYGTVGYPARASGVKTDTRHFHPYDAYKNLSINISIEHIGDVRSRYMVRVHEVYESLSIILSLLDNMPVGDVDVKNISLNNATGSAYGITEGWRGEIIHYISIKNGKITRAKIKDPSFSNWQAMVPTINGNIIGDFPLINKSFNLSYSGNDL